MLWSLSSETAEQYFKAWNTCVKLAYRVPRSIYTYLVEGYLAKDFLSLRNQILSRYPSFFSNLLNSPSGEVRLLANIVGRDCQSNTYKNLRYIQQLSGLDPWVFSSYRIKSALPVKMVPESEMWRINFLTKLIQIRDDKYTCVENSQSLCSMIDSLCNT